MQNQTMMLGTTGNNDYLVIHEKDGLRLGVKPVFEFTMTPAGPGTVIGVRVRVAANPTDTESPKVINVGHTAKTAYPQFPYDKADDVRASRFIGCFIPGIPESQDEVVKKLSEDDVLPKVLAELGGYMGGATYIHPALEISTYLQADVLQQAVKFVEEVVAKKALHNKNNPKPKPKPKVKKLDEAGKVVQGQFGKTKD